MSSSRLLDTLVLALVPAIIFTTGDQVISQSFPNGTFVDLEPVASVNTPDFYEGFPGLTADGLELYFTRGELAITGSSDIWVTRRTTKDEEFGPPIPLGPAINTEAGEFLGSISPDGLAIYFNSDRSGGLGDQDIYRATRASRQDAFSNPVNLEQLNSPSYDGGAFVSMDGMSLYFDSDRETGDGPIDLYHATREGVNDEFDNVTELVEINTQNDEFHPTISSDNRVLFFSDWINTPNRPGGVGSIDIWYATRENVGEAFNGVTNLGGPINTSLSDASLFVGYEWPASTTTVYFFTNWPNVVGTGYGDIWQATWILETTLPGDYNNNGVLDAADIDMLTTAAATNPNDLTYDLNDDQHVDFADVTIWAKDLRKTWIGDANVDGRFNNQDFVDIFIVGKYEQDEFAVWSEGDWDADGRFSSSDFVAAFVDGGYEQGLRTDVVAIPEPSSMLLLTFGCLMAIRTRRRRTENGRRQRQRQRQMRHNCDILQKSSH